MALELKGRINREHRQACSYSTLITAEWKDKSEEGEEGERQRAEGVEGQLKCKIMRRCEFVTKEVKRWSLIWARSRNRLRILTEHWIIWYITLMSHSHHYITMTLSLKSIYYFLVFQKKEGDCCIDYVAWQWFSQCGKCYLYVQIIS